ncbi:hypothetical protein IH779_02425 [Patescibacteria group bacterium]|nr:hypothetical protein [Patescibacteria group bacterium]
MTDIEEILRRIAECMEREDHQEDWFRALLALTEIGDIAKYITHDPTLNPGARPHGIPAEEELAWGQVFVQIFATAMQRNIDIHRALEVGLVNWEQADWRKRRTENGKREIEGEIAYKGLAEGKAYVVSEEHPFSELEQGCVLVIEFFTPKKTSYLVAKKPIAIVTDQGGTLSHPAIIAREFQIPCIVGTGNATDIIKHGEQIIVNASGKDKGFVRKNT